MKSSLGLNGYSAAICSKNLGMKKAAPWALSRILGDSKYKNNLYQVSFVAVVVVTLKNVRHKKKLKIMVLT